MEKIIWKDLLKMEVLQSVKDERNKTETATG
jgi:hypothetical protein